MLANGYINFNLRIPKNSYINHKTTLFQVLNGNPQYFKNLPQKVIKDLKIKELIEVHNVFFKYDQILDKDEEVEKFRKNFYTYINAVCKSLKLPMATGIITKAVVCYPFFRIAYNTHTAIVSYLTVVEYGNGSTELLVTEAVPEKEILEKIGIDSLYDLTESSLFSVRYGMYDESNIYSYGGNIVESDHYSFNYILKQFLSENFDVNAEKMLKMIGFISRGEWEQSLNKKGEKKKSIFFNTEEQIILIGIKNENLEYQKYMEEALCQAFYYTYVYCAYEEFMKLIEKKCTSPIEDSQKQLLATYLNKVINSDDLNLRTDAIFVIKKEKKNQFHNFVMIIAEAAGAFCGGFNNTNIN